MNFKEKLSDEIYEMMHLGFMESEMWDNEIIPNLIYIFETELLDKELAKARTRLPFFSSPEEYWMTQGKIHFIKELKEKLHYRDDTI